MTDDLPPIERLQVIELHPDDTLVVTLPAHTTLDRFERMTELIGDKFPGHQTLVVTAEVTVEVVRPTDESSDVCRISDNGSVSHRWACDFGPDCPASDDPRVKAANARARRLPETPIDPEPA